MTRSPFLLPVLLACASLTVMAGATIAPGLPGLEAHFSGEPNADYLARLILTIPGLAIAVAAPLAGWVADRIGRRLLLNIGVALYIVSGSAGLWLSDLTLILASRALLGVAVGMVMVCSMALVTDHFLGPERDRAMGIQSSAMAIGGVVFITAGSFLADISWRAPFAVYLAPLVLFPLIHLFVTKPPDHAEEPGAIDGRFPARHAMLLYAIGFVSMVAFYFIPAQLPYYALELGADSARHAGFAIVVSQICAAIASAMYRRVRTRLGNWQVLALSFALMAAGFLLVSAADTLTGMYLAMPLIGTGLGLSFPNLTTWLMAKVPATMRGRASGGMSTAIFIGQFISPLISQPLAKAAGLSGAYMWLAVAALALVVAPAAVMSMRRPAAGSAA